MRRIACHLLVVGLLAVAGRPALAGSTVEIFKAKDKSLLASFETFTPVCSSGIDSAIDVQWNSSLFRSTGAGTTTQTTIFVTFRYVDSCTGDSLLMSGFSLSPSGSVPTNLSTGHVNAVVPVSTDPESPPVKTATVNLSLDFVATGPTKTVRNTSVSRGGGIITINNFSISSRTATASGSATATLPLSTGPKFVNLIGSPSLSASIGKDTNGSVTVIHKTP